MRFILLFLVGVLTISLASCGMMQTTMMKMMGMGDMAAGLHNMDKVMKTKSEQLIPHINSIQESTLAYGKQLFSDPKLGGATQGVSCNSCHPNGGTTGGEAQIPMRQYRMPIPSLIGAGSTFPKYKVPNATVIGLKEMNNNCNRMFMGAKGLKLDGREGIALEAYVKSLSNGEIFEVGKSRMKM